MNINTYPSSQITLNKSIIPDPSLNNGTHYSHAGIGGYIEVPTLKDMYDIPSISNDLNNTIDPNGLTSGKRKLGMIVYVLENNKYYQLKPRYKDTRRVIPWPVLSGISDLFRGFLMNPSRISYLDDSTSSIVWSNIEQLTGKNNITSDDVNSLKKYGYYTDPGDPLSIQDAYLVGTGDSSVPIDPTYGIPTDDLAWTEVFVKENFSNLAALNLYSTGNAAAYAGQICSTVDAKKIYILDSNLSPYEFGAGFYPLNSNPSGYLTADDLTGGSPVENLVYTTGDQSIDGNKNFTGSLSISGKNVIASNGTVSFIYKIAEADFPNITIDPKALYFIY
jgi:hypothetical protein